MAQFSRLRLRNFTFIFILI